MLLHKASKPINEENVKKVLHSIGINKDDGEVKALVAAMAEVDIEKAIKEAAVPITTSATTSAQGGVTKKEEKKEEPKEDPDKAAVGLSSLFG